MAKANANKKSEVPQVKASARYVRVAPRKARLVADQVRGMGVSEAQTLLQFSTRGAAVDIGKLVASAAANAENNHDLIADDLEIFEIRVDEGPTLKRWRPRARGRATRIDKKTSHMSVVLRPTAE
jgi:large subunit ribosomal protein L22